MIGEKRKLPSGGTDAVYYNKEYLGSLQNNPLRTGCTNL